MTWHTHVLKGCTPRPLAAYLRALAVLRIVAEQRDPQARGWWAGECFHLLTRLSRQELLDFFLLAWSPAATVSPWNKGSGFLDGPTKVGLGPIEGSTAERFSCLRDGIRAARAMTTAMEAAVEGERAIKQEAKSIKDKVAREKLKRSPEYKQRLAAATREAKGFKDAMIPRCQMHWRGSELRWLRAAVVLDADGKSMFPSLLGTGGNDGRLDYTKNAYMRIAELFDLDSPSGQPRGGTAELLAAALFGEPALGLAATAIGQFSPAAAGGANATTGPTADSATNGWELLFALEGALSFAAAASRRLDSRGQVLAAAPFAVRGRSAGHGSASNVEENPRGEQWMPLWERPWSATEVASVLAEGRAQIGARRGQDTLDLAKAVARLGVARGIASFERYGYLERNGQSNFAVPLGRWQVKADQRATLLDDLDRNDWFVRVQRAGRDKFAPASVTRAVRQLEESLLAVLSHGGESARWQACLLALADLEWQLVISGAFSAGKRLAPIPRLGPRWIVAADDGGPELRLALALALAAGSWQRGARRDPVRHHWLPLQPGGERFLTTGGDKPALRADVRVVATGRDAVGDLIAIVQRRLIEADSGAGRSLPLVGKPGTEARAVDIEAFVSGQVDADRVCGLARALAATHVTRLRPRHLPRADHGPVPMDSTWATLRLCHLANSLPDGRRIPTDPAIMRLLAAGDLAAAVEVANRRLRACGIDSSVRGALGTAATARRLAASLAFPISPALAASLVKQLDPAGAASTTAALLPREGHHVA